MTAEVNGRNMKFDEDAILADAARDCQDLFDAPIALAMVGGQLKELHHQIREGDEISFLTVRDEIGYDTLRRSYCMLFLAAVNALYAPDAPKVRINFSISSGYYCSITGKEIDSAFLEDVTEAMNAMVQAKLPIRKYQTSTREARKLFAERNMPDKEKLFRTRISGQVNVYELNGYIDYFYGAMMYDTSHLCAFRLIPWEDGVVLQLPEEGSFSEVPEFLPSVKLFEARWKGEVWCGRHGMGTVGDLNERIINGETSHAISVAEAYQEGRISSIAAAIVERPEVKFVMVAGPSSSGKTTFSQRLSIQLEAHGKKPHYIGVDNYFVNREDMIPGPDGKLDFEALEAVDLKQFNQDMTDLLEGKTIELPTFDFVTGKRVMSGEKMTLQDNEILVIEGIHCLNDRLSASLPKESKYRIYISALTSLNIDEHNRVSSGDGRLIRRMIRDYRTRGASASKTLNMWGSVQSGEKKNIFPYQDSADVVFNSALPYELAAIKTFAQPLLFQIGEDDPAYLEAKRLLKFLDYFLAVPVSGVPENSILREFIGGGCFRL